MSAPVSVYGKRRMRRGAWLSHIVSCLSHLINSGIQGQLQLSLGQDTEEDTDSFRYKGSQLEQDQALPCPLFFAMLTKTYTDPQKNTIRLPGTTFPALSRPPTFSTAARQTTVLNSGEPQKASNPTGAAEVKAKYLLVQLNLSVCHSIIKQSGSPNHVIHI